MTTSGSENGNSASRVSLTVINQTGVEVYFNMERSTQVKNLVQSYCERESLDVNSVALLFDRCFLRWEQTPNELGMKDGDKIYAFSADSLRSDMHAHSKDHNDKTAAEKTAEEQILREISVISTTQSHLAEKILCFENKLVETLKEIRSNKRARLNKTISTEREKKFAADTPHIHIKVVVQSQAETFIYFKITRSVKLHKIMRAYYKHQGRDWGSTCFMFNHIKIEMEHTPDELQMQDGDEIDAFDLY